MPSPRRNAPHRAESPGRDEDAAVTYFEQCPHRILLAFRTESEWLGWRKVRTLIPTLRVSQSLEQLLSSPESFRHLNVYTLRVTSEERTDFLEMLERTTDEDFLTMLHNVQELYPPSDEYTSFNMFLSIRKAMGELFRTQTASAEGAQSCGFASPRTLATSRSQS